MVGLISLEKVLYLFEGETDKNQSDKRFCLCVPVWYKSPWKFCIYRVADKSLV